MSGSRWEYADKQLWDEVKEINRRIERHDETLRTLIGWITQSANSPLSFEEARKLFSMLEEDEWYDRWRTLYEWVEFELYRAQNRPMGPGQEGVLLDGILSKMIELEKMMEPEEETPLVFRTDGRDIPTDWSERWMKNNTQLRAGAQDFWDKAVLAAISGMAGQPDYNIDFPDSLVSDATRIADVVTEAREQRLSPASETREDECGM